MPLVGMILIFCLAVVDGDEVDALLFSAVESGHCYGEGGSFEGEVGGGDFPIADVFVLIDGDECIVEGRFGGGV